MNLLRARFLPTMASMLFVGALGVAGCTANATIGTDGNGSCAPDTTVSTCSSGGGWSCTGTDAPEDSDTSLDCSDGVSGNAGSTLYCCVTRNTTDTTCADDSTVTCSPGSFGFSCSNSTEQPTQAYPTLNCSTGVPGNAGSETYCCTYDTSGGGTGTSSTCAADTTVTGCQDSNGYSCTGGDTPDQGDSSLLCSDGTAGNAGSTLYCCVSSSTPANSCQADNTLNCPSAGSFGFTCSTPTDKPTDVYSSLNCSAGVAASDGSETYCCTDGSN